MQPHHHSSRHPLPRVARLQFDQGAPPLGLGSARPVLRWEIETLRPDWRQAGYELSVVSSLRGRETTGPVISGGSVGIPWPFGPLRSRERAQVSVQVWGADGDSSGWFGPFFVEAGLLEASDWQGSFVGAPWDDDPLRPGPSPLVRREFEVRGPVAHARLYTASLGLSEVELNGVAVGDAVFAPGWTSYGHRLRYSTQDVAALLVQGPNALGAWLADGWYRGRLGYNGGRRAIYGDRLGFLAQLEVDYVDGRRQRVVTGPDWQVLRGPILRSEIYDGEVYDARAECPGWSRPGASGAWEPVVVVPTPQAVLTAPSGPPVRRTELLPVRQVVRTPSGRTILDFGQNLVGRVRLTVEGPRGTQVRLRHAEVLEDGELAVRPLRTARAEDTYILKGEGAETWEPRFTFHGFRYAEVEGWPGPVVPDSFQAVVCHSDLERTGWFTCSDPLVNRLHENIVWSVRGNFLEVPTDCPQRDERLGWTGDIQIFGPTAAFLFDTAGFLASWLKDLALEQRDDGAVPNFVPNINAAPIVPSAAWGDAAVLVPWALYRAYGDPGILRAQFPSIRAWLSYLEETVGPTLVWSEGFQFGDWLDPASPPGRPGDSRTDPALVATAYFARTAEVAGTIAGLVGEESLSRRWSDLAGRVRRAFAEEFLSPSGRPVSDTATACSLVIAFGLAPDERRRQRAGRRLAELVRDAGYRISTGFIGTPLICDALCQVGASRAAYRLLLQRECPSWLYPVTQGATTMWERWDSLLPDGRVNPGDTTSFNHYALGAVADWLHRSVGGLSAAEPGYRKLLVCPEVGGALTWAEARLRTPYGLASCRWSLEAAILTLRVCVPANTSAEVVFPRCSRAPIQVGSGDHVWSYEVTPDVPEPVTLDTTLSDLLSRPREWERLKAEIPYLAQFETITQISSTTTIAQQLDFLPDGEPYKARLKEVLARKD